MFVGSRTSDCQPLERELPKQKRRNFFFSAVETISLLDVPEWTGCFSKETLAMKVLTIVTAALGLSLIAGSAGAASFTVYQGGSDKVIGTCSDTASCHEVLRSHPGKGERVVNDQTGEVRNPQGHRGHHNDASDRDHSGDRDESGDRDDSGERGGDHGRNK